MGYEQAKDVIVAVLASLPDEALPEPDRIEHDGEKRIAWFGDSGYHIGSAKRRQADGSWVRSPESRRSSAAGQALEREAMARIDRADMEATQ